MRRSRKVMFRRGHPPVLKQFFKHFLKSFLNPKNDPFILWWSFSVNERIYFKEIISLKPKMIYFETNSQNIYCDDLDLTVKNLKIQHNFSRQIFFLFIFSEN